MKLDAKTIKELIDSIAWENKQQIRLFWLRINDIPRNEIAREIVRLDKDNAILPLILREPLFVSANAILSDFVKLIETNRTNFDKVS
ncbi:TPA: hypothetical protein ONC52_004713, partial [Enterobacter asburiae]|nr:hypothetical protein [Enterobacter asburiae]